MLQAYLESRYRHTSFDRLMSTYEVLKFAIDQVYGTGMDTAWPDVRTYLDSLKVLVGTDTRKAEDATYEFTDAQLREFFQNLDLSSTYNLVRGAVATLIYLNGLAPEVVRTLTHAGKLKMGN